MPSSVGLLSIREKQGGQGAPADSTSLSPARCDDAGGVLALKGECPSCTEEVYSFLQVRSAPPCPAVANPPLRLLLSLDFVAGGNPLRWPQMTPQTIPTRAQLAEHKEGEEAKLHCNCHVCGKPLIFQARVASKGPGGLIKASGACAAPRLRLPPPPPGPPRVTLPARALLFRRWRRGGCTSCQQKRTSSRPPPATKPPQPLADGEGGESPARPR